MQQTQTGGGIVVNPSNQILVVSQHGTSWSLPKGHIDPGENAKQAAVREIKEESGITQLTLIKELGSYRRHRIGLHGGEDTSELKYITIYLYTTTETKLKPIDPENPEARWVEADSVAKLLTHPKDKAFYESVLPEVKMFITSRR